MRATLRIAALLCGLALLATWPARLEAQDRPDRVRERSWDVGPHGPLAVDVGAAGVWQRLQKVRTTASVLYTTGHPDDEHAGTLTLLSRGVGARTSLLTLNRGEGGANAIGPELFDALGLVRTEELRLSGRWYGLDDQYFTTAVDYGFSKTLDEAMRSWDREAVLGDMVRVIRLNRPLVVISRWHGSERDGHGHHQAAGVLTPEAVAAAADPTRFPDQIEREGLRPWRVRRLYRGGLRADEPAGLELDAGATSPWLGDTYTGFGARGLSLQRSQTSGRVRTGGSPTTRYGFVSGERTPGPGPAADPFVGLDTTLPGLPALLGERVPEAVTAALREADGHLARAVDAFDFRAPSAIAPHLALARASLARAAIGLAAGSETAFALAIERAELDEALRAALGVELEALATPAGADPATPMGAVVPGARLSVHAHVANSGAETVEILELRLEAPVGWTAEAEAAADPRLEPGDTRSATLDLVVPTDAEPSRPWFHRPSIAQNRYSVRDSAALSSAEARPLARLVAVVRYRGESLEGSVPVRTVESRAPYGTVRRDLVVAPALSISTSPSATIVTPGQTAVNVDVEVVSNAPGPLDADIDLALPPGWVSEPPAHFARLDGAGRRERVRLRVTLPSGAPASATGIGAILRARARSAGRAYAEGYLAIEHRDLGTTYLYSDASVVVRSVDVRVSGPSRVGYVMGVGDEVPSAIRQLGADVTLLDESDLAVGDLYVYDVVMIGTRAYAVRPDLVANNARLLDWTRAGGHLVVLYQTPEYTPETQAPIPATLPGNAEEVSEEDAPVRILAPDHPMLRAPNRISSTDFDGWIEQRGSKFFATWSDEYTPLVETHDTGQVPQSGVWLTAEVGAGRFTYIALALHRQLPYAVPGAYRILANLISRTDG